MKTNLFKQISIPIIAMGFTFSLFYLAGSFYSVSFNIADWGPDCRGFVSFFGLFIGVCAGLGTALAIDSKP